MELVYLFLEGGHSLSSLFAPHYLHSFPHRRIFPFSYSQPTTGLSWACGPMKGGAYPQPDWRDVICQRRARVKVRMVFVCQDSRHGGGRLVRLEKRKVDRCLLGSRALLLRCFCSIFVQSVDRVEIWSGVRMESGKEKKTVSITRDVDGVGLTRKEIPSDGK